MYQSVGSTDITSKNKYAFKSDLDAIKPPRTINILPSKGHENAFSEK
jgi:hypothetical protein